MQPYERKGWTQRNASNINFSQPKYQQKNQDYFRGKSRVGNMMKEKIDQPKWIRTFTYSDRLTENKKQYSVPQFEGVKFERNNQQYEDFLQENKKFKKPYDQCTKYVDSLMKNKTLLRRGQFQVSVKTNFPLTKKKKQNKLQTQRTQFIFSKKLQRNHSIREKLKTLETSADRKKGFDKTLSHFFEKYQTMMQTDASSKDSKVAFKNSMNRVLAAEMIEHRLMQTGKSFKNKEKFKYHQFQ